MLCILFGLVWDVLCLPEAFVSFWVGWGWVVGTYATCVDMGRFMTFAHVCPVLYLFDRVCDVLSVLCAV